MFPPKVEVVEHMYDVTIVVLVLFLEVIKDPDLLLGLTVEPLLIPHLYIDHSMDQTLYKPYITLRGSYHPEILYVIHVQL